MTDPHVKAVVLPSIVDLDALDAIRETLLDALQAGAVAVDGGAVERLSTNALFMLLSAAETARAAGVGFSLARASDAMSAAIERLGLDGAFAPLLKG